MPSKINAAGVRSRRMDASCRGISFLNMKSPLDHEKISSNFDSICSMRARDRL